MHKCSVSSPWTQEELTWLNTTSQDLGFLEMSSVTLASDPRFSAYHHWIQDGHHGELQYLANNLDKREHPHQLGEQLHSAIAFLHPYPSKFQSRHIARYAWGEDYHHTIKSKIKTLASAFQTRFGPLTEDKVCVDTVPLLERSLAERSGMGWIGKNGCFISRKHGSFLLLSFWLTSKTLNNDQISPKGTFHCGSCTRCMDACPTQAFVQPGQLHTPDCLSAITIENRKNIDPSFFPHLDEQVFGCDICQTVCPWNRHHQASVENEHLPPAHELLRLPESDFRAYFRKTALERPGWVGLRRNFLILASHDEEHGPDVIKEHLSHSNPIVQKTAKDLWSALSDHKKI